jgi:threonine dehydrogenase-like Zn-dependent dehydrogenase
VRGLTFSLSVPGHLAARLADRWAPALPAAGWLPGLSLARLPAPGLPGARWVRLRPILSGVCASDLALITGRSSPALSPFVSFPAVLGHEVLARVTEVAPAVRGVRPGDRVVVDPFISCEARNLPPCPPCARGDSRLCTRAAEDSLAPGMLIGYCRALPGGWSEEMVAHENQLHQVPDEVSDEAAVLVEPLAVALHAVLLSPPPAVGRALVLGAGTIGLCTIAALKVVVPTCRVVAVARHPFQSAAARRLGAEPVETGQDAGDAAVASAGARRYRPVWGPPVYAGGFDRVYDCAGTERSMDDALRVSGPGAHVVLVGCTGGVRLDLSFVWARELRVLGSYGYGPEPGAGGRHTFQLALDLLRRGTPDLAALVTHRFPLERWRAALGTSLRRARHGAVKVVFEGAPA